MGLTFRHLQNPLNWRTCPSCRTNLVDSEIGEEVKQFCKPSDFHSKLLGGRDLETNKIEYWKCPECRTVFPAQDKPIPHIMSDAYLKNV